MIIIANGDGYYSRYTILNGNTHLYVVVYIQPNSQRLSVAKRKIPIFMSGGPVDISGREVVGVRRDEALHPDVMSQRGTFFGTLATTH